MKIYLIKASAGSDYSKYKAETGGPPQNIFSAAAAMPAGTNIGMCDETIGMSANFKSDADVVAVFMSTPDAYRAYEICQKFRAKGKVTVLGGLHTFFFQEEAAEHADTIIIGESEGVWEQLFADIENKRLQAIYKRTQPLDLSELKNYPTNLIPVSKYNYTWSVVVSRGCPMHCDFCLVHQFFDKYTLRPIEHIVEEVKALKKLGVKWVELHSDNLTHNRKYALELFEALEPLNMNFYGETTILIAKDEALLKAAQKAGVKALLFGIETPSEEALKEQGKDFVKPEQIKAYVNIIKQYGIEVVGDFLFGFDAHDTNIFSQTIEFIKAIGVDKAYPHLMIPFPGSESYKKLDAQGRIKTKDWSKYDGSHAVYSPAKMSAEELEMGTWEVYQEIERWNNKVKPKAQLKTAPSTDRREQRIPLANNIKWKTSIALILLPPAIYFNYTSFYFAALFLIWSIQGIKKGHTFFLDTFDRKEQPVFFWLISILWILLSLWSLVYSEPFVAWMYYGY
ncbi:MAG: B12-binding domain-containing radical SAM protein [Bacteroidales bacterium]|nr:B12-binding domain-containing radical SAM protein [Bacteroidales bacterium]